MTGAVLERGGLVARLAAGTQDVAAAQELRYRAFVDPNGTGRDADAFDAASAHLLVERAGQLLATFRYQRFPDAGAAAQGYSGQVYDLAPLSALGGPMVEMGRFCIAPRTRDPDVLRIAWGAMTRIVDRAGAVLLFGCSSFRGTAPAPYADALALLATRHLGPAAVRPARRAPEVVALRAGPHDPARAQAAMPPLLRTYLMMGGWVSDHAVVDRGLNTLHVFTGVEIAKVPPARARALRALAAD